MVKKLRVLVRTTVLLLASIAACSDSSDSVDMGSNEWVVQRVVVDAGIDAGNPHDIVDPVWWNGDIYGSVDEYEASLRNFSKGQRLIFAAIWYISEVDNGGHDQFFFNSTGIVWPDAIEAFREVGLPEISEILLESASRLGGSPSRDRYERQAQLNETKAVFKDLDDRLYEVESRVDIDAALADYIKVNRADFYVDGSVRKPK